MNSGPRASAPLYGSVGTLSLVALRDELTLGEDAELFCPNPPSFSPSRSWRSFPSRFTTLLRRFSGFWRREAFSVLALTCAGLSLWSQHMLFQAVHSDRPEPLIAAAVRTWPFDPTYRLALVEWPWAQLTNPTDAIDGLTEFLRNDPLSVDALRTRMFYESQVPGMIKQLQADAQTLQRLAPVKEF